MGNPMVPVPINAIFRAVEEVSAEFGAERVSGFSVGFMVSNSRLVVKGMDCFCQHRIAHTFDIIFRESF
jgi:hypothetical protein